VVENEKHIRKLVRESISSRKQDKKKEIFDYHSLVDGAWIDVIKEAQDFQKINFDLENNDSTNEKKAFYIKKNLRKDQPVKYEVKAEMYMAGGDWECPVMYFKVEITRAYSLISSDYYSEKKYVWDLERKGFINMHRKYVLIPPVEAGNQLKKTEKRYRAWQDSEDGVDYKDVQITDQGKKEAWIWLEKLLETAINKRHKMLDESHENKIRATIKEQINLLTEAPRFENAYKAKKIFKDGLMKFDEWIYVDNKIFKLTNGLIDVVSAMKFNNEVSIDYLSNNEKTLSFIFRVHRNSLIPSDVRFTN